MLLVPRPLVLLPLYVKFRSITMGTLRLESARRLDGTDAKFRGALSLFRATQRRTFLVANHYLAPYRRHTFCQAGLHYGVYYRHLAHLSDRLGSLEVAISLIPKINYRPGSPVRATLDTRLILNPYFSSTQSSKWGQSISARNSAAFLGKVSSIKFDGENITRCKLSSCSRQEESAVKFSCVLKFTIS